MALKPLLYNNDHAGSISYLVYIGGMEIPSSGFDVSYGVWEIPQATIRLVPDPILHRLGAEDRIPVQCFYLDQWQHTPPKYCLMFDGEIVAWGTQKTGTTRSLTFTCVDYMAILTQTFFFLMSTFDDFAVGTSGAGIGVSAASVQTPGFGALYPYSLFAQGLADTGDTRSDNLIERPIDYAYNIVRALIKLTQPNRSVPAANFFAPWTQKTNFHRRWVATPYFDADPQDPRDPGLFPILKAVQDTNAISAIARQAAQAANGSLWSMLQEVLRTVMCELSMLPTPAAVKSDYRTLLPQGKPTNYSEGIEPVFLTQYFVKPQSYYSLPPVCNVFFPSQIESAAYQENYAAQPTRAYYNEATITNILSNNAGNTGTGAQAAATLMQDAMTTGYPEEVDIAIRDARDAALQNGKNMLVYPEEYFKGPVILRKQLPRWFAFLIDSMRGTLNQSGTSNEPTPTGGAESLNNVSQYSECEFGPVYFGEPHRPTTPSGIYVTSNPNEKLLTQLDISPAEVNFAGRPFNQRCTATEASIIVAKSVAKATPGACVPPQSFPLRPPTAWALFDGRFVPMIWGIRSGGIHGGHDYSCPLHTEVVATTDGTIVTITAEPRATCTSRRGNRLTNATRDSRSEGNCIYLQDDLDGIHRYMHLYDLAAGIAVGVRVSKGQLIAYSGSTGQSDGPHLHYDVHDSTRKFRMPYGNRLASLARHPGSTAAPPAPAPSPTPAPANGNGTPPQSDQQNADLNPNAARANGGTGDVSSAVAAGDTSRNLFKRYAMCDYFTERYAQRNGTLSMPFNPYPIPGFSLAAFDRRTTMLDTVGYLTNVQHSVSAQGWGTTLSYSQGRTFQEMFALMARDVALDAARLAVNRTEINHTIENRYAAADTRTHELLTVDHGLSTRDGQIEKYNTRKAPGLVWISPWDTTPPAVAGTSAPADPNQTQEAIDARLGGFPAPVGDVRMAPAEPIEEVRKLQELETANAFYRAMFWQLEKESQLSGADLNAADVLRADSESERSGRNSTLTSAQITAAQGTIDNATVAQALEGSTGESAALTRSRNRTTTQTSRAQLGTSAVFRQEDVLRMVVDTPEGDQVLDIENSGTSSASRTQALLLIRKAATNPGEMTDTDIQRLAESAAGRSDAEGMTAQDLQWCLPRKTYRRLVSAETGEDLVDASLLAGETWAYVPCPEDQLKLLSFLRAQDRRWHTQEATTNVRGDVALEPTPAAADLWESFNAAMRYNARPICTLDEYLFFLGPDAPGGDQGDEAAVAVHPTNSNLGRNDYNHPAKFYKVIRSYRQGPPLLRPADLGLTPEQAAASGTPPVPGTPVNPATAPAPTNAPVAANAAAQGTTAPETFPAARANPDQAVRTLARQWGTLFYDDLVSSFGRPNGPARDRVDAILMSFLVDNDARIRGMRPEVSRAEATALATLVRTQLLVTTASGDYRISRDAGAPFLAAFARTQTFALPLSDTNGAASKAADYVRAYIASNNPTAAYEAQRNAEAQAAHARSLEEERSVAGDHTIQAQYIAGVPASFPETRARWEALLQRYRDNVLNRLDPRG